MSIDVLKSKAEIKKARCKLRSRELSFTSSWWMRLARKTGISKTLNMGDELKSWDVLKTVEFIEKNTHRNASILDIGTFSSELPCILHKLRYTGIVGIDLNPDVKKMPYSDAVRYEIANFLNTKFADESFDAITAISVIEHGFDSTRLLGEVARLLHPGGYFIASFDYWPTKVDTHGILFFGMNWIIFSADDVRQLIEDAKLYNLFPPGKIDLTAGDKPIKSAQREYTFAWIVLQKGATNVEVR